MTSSPIEHNPSEAESKIELAQIQGIPLEVVEELFPDTPFPRVFDNYEDYYAYVLENRFDKEQKDSAWDCMGKYAYKKREFWYPKHYKVLSEAEFLFYSRMIKKMVSEQGLYCGSGCGESPPDKPMEQPAQGNAVPIDGLPKT